MNKIKNEDKIAVLAITGIVLLFGALMFGVLAQALMIFVALLACSAIGTYALWYVLSKVARNQRFTHMVTIATLCVALVFSISVFTYAAKKVEYEFIVDDASFVLTANLSKANVLEVSDNGKGVITIKTEGYKESGSCYAEYVTYTITNKTLHPDGTTPREVTFTVKVTESKSNTDEKPQGDGTYTLKDGSIEVKAMTGWGADGTEDKDRYNTVTITISDVFLEAVTAPLVTTVKNYIGGTTSVNGTVQQETQKDYSAAQGQEYELLATADIQNGYQFLEWRSSAGLSSTENPLKYIPSSNTTIWPVFIKTDGALFCVASKPDIKYGYLDEAITAAKSNGTIVVCGSGKVYHSDGETSNFTIGSGVTLLLPYSDSDWSMAAKTETVEGPSNSTLKYANAKLVTALYEGAEKIQSKLLLPNEDVTYTLTIPSGTTLNIANGGKLVIGGILTAGHETTAGVSCATAGAHSNMILEQGAAVNVSGIASICGYILGDGQVNVASTGTVYQPYILMDYRNGPYVMSARDETNGDIVCFYRYTVQNIQSDVHMVYGAKMLGYVDLFTAELSILKERHNVTEADLISPTGLIRLSEGATLDIFYNPERYVAEDPKSAHYSQGMYHRVGTTTLEFNGGMTFGSLALEITVMGLTAAVDSLGDHFSIPYNYNIVLNKGTYQVPNKLKFLPGATMIVNEGATLQVSESGELAILEGLRDHSTMADTYDPDASQPYHYPHTTVLKGETFGGNGSANLILNGGTLQVDVGGKLGGLVQTTGNSKSTIIMNGVNTVTTVVGVRNMQTLDYKIPVVNINLGSLFTNHITGRTVYNLTAQVYNPNGERITLTSGKIYKAVDSITNVVSSCDYRVYTTYNDDNQIANLSIADLNANVIGTWVEESTEVNRDVEFSASNIRLGNSLDMLFAFPKAGFGTDSPNGCYVKIVRTYANGIVKIEEIPFGSWKSTTVNQQECYYVIYNGFAAKDMCDTVTVLVCYRNAEGKEMAVSAIYVDSIRAYSDRMQTMYPEANYPYLNTLIKDMLQYGAACQLMFNYNTSNLANKNIGTTATDPTIPDGYDGTPVFNKYWFGSNVLANSNTSFVVGFTNEFKEGMYFTYTFTNHWGKKVSIEVPFEDLIAVYDEDGTTVKYYYHGLANLRLADLYLDDGNNRTYIDISFAIYNEADRNTSLATWSDSILRYTARMSMSIDDVYSALLKFADSAYNYLHSTEEVA